jgi:multiple sugar transport system substrate-binding protein
MSDFSRRDVLKAGVAATAAVAGSGLLADAASAQTSFKLTPEKGAKLRVLRWSEFVPADWPKWLEQTKQFSDQTGIEVRVDKESWEDVRPKAAVAANVGAGPDIIIGTNDDPHKFPDKLVDLTDLATYLGNKYGGWYDSVIPYSTRNKKWIGLPQGTSGTAMNYRISHMRAAGFEQFPKDFPGFLKLCQALAAKGTPPGYALGHATGDANGWTHWVLWGHGGKVVDKKNSVVLDSPETIAALEYAKQLYATFIPGVLSWLDPSNNKAFLDGQLSLTSNGISIYTVAKTSPDPALQAIAKDMDHALFPIGPIGRPTVQANFLQAYVFKYTKYPNAAKDYLRFMWEGEQYMPWVQVSNGYISHPLKAFEANPIWTADPKNLPFRDTTRDMLYSGYEGTLGASSAATLGDFIVVDMFGEAATGSKSPKEAAQRAAERAKRYYKA